MLSARSRDAQGREKILVVEDSALQRSVIVQGLSQQGFRVLGAADGQAGLELAIEQVPDLVVTDSEMPVMNGRDMTRELRKVESLKDIPVLMLTAADTPQARAKSEHAGVSAYLAKPFVPDKVVIIAEKLISERRLLRERQAMQQYLSESAVEAAVDAAGSTGDVRKVMRAEQQFVTVLFADIVGFTPMTEQMEPEDLIKLLNEYFDAMAPLFRENGGIIDKFIGDAIMAIFVGSDDEGHSHSAYNAVRTGLKMIQTLETFNAERGDTVNIRVGINSGPVIMGDIGSRFYRRDFTVIGDHVNIAARLESAAEHGTVLISESTYQLVDELVGAQRLGPIEVKGKSEPISVYKVTHILNSSVEALEKSVRREV
jgi:class 3 adenylate cyclase